MKFGNATIGGKFKSQMFTDSRCPRKVLFCPQNRQNDLKQRRGKHFIQISAVAKVIAKEALVQPISARLALHPGLAFAPQSPRSLLFSLKKIMMPSLVLFIISMVHTVSILERYAVRLQFYKNEFEQLSSYKRVINIRELPN